LQAQDTVPGPVEVHFELVPHPPLLVAHLLIGVEQVFPLFVGELYPKLQAHVLRPGPVLLHLEFIPHAPLLVRQLLMATQS